MNDEEFKGKMLSFMGQQSEFQKNANGWMEKLDEKLDGVRTHGCVVGKQLKEEIREIKSRPRKGNMLGGVAGGSLVGFAWGIIEALKFWKAQP